MMNLVTRREKKERNVKIVQKEKVQTFDSMSMSTRHLSTFYIIPWLFLLSLVLQRLPNIFFI